MVKASTSRQTWIDAAYATFRDEGLAAVRVEPLARSLGATKGSFYWHFTDRAELVAAVVARWEAEHTDAVIALAQTGGDARARVEALFTAVASRRHDSARLYVEAAAEGVSDVVARVSQRRVDYLADLLVELGQDPDEARRRSSVALAAVVGLGQLAAVGVRPDDPAALTATALAMTLA